jgi:polysaccharide biosynthesis/export protein
MAAARRGLELIRTFFLALLALSTLTLPISAQVRPDSVARQLRQLAGQRLAPTEILRRLRESGMTREQVRERLRQAGYDPTLADRYFDQLERVDTTGVPGALRNNRLVQSVPMPSGSLIDGLRRIGVLLPGDTIVPADSVGLDPTRPRRRAARDSLDPQVFGKELFATASPQFQTVLEGPVDPDYRMGPGDEFTLIVTGDVELMYELTVSREGFVIIPQVGQVPVAGLTMEQMRNRLHQRLARIFSGVQTGTTQFDVSMGRLRRIGITITGEVDTPGAYPVSGGATVFNALYEAGGPSRNGSFRSIHVRRGDRLIRTVDLYDFLLRGDKSGDIRLEQGDVIFVPVLERRVTVKGSVRRPAIYELKANETLTDVLRFTGGPDAEAALDRIQIDRILPAGQRSPGKDRTIVDISLEELRSNQPIPLEDGDVITVSAISSARRNRVNVSGDVHRPGEFEWRPGMTALDLVNAAQGLLPSAYLQSAQVHRLSLQDSSRILVPVTFDNPGARDYAGNVRLEDLDELVVFSRTKLMNTQEVEIFGFVKSGGVFPYSANMSVLDLVLQAGGFKEGAVEQQAEVARRVRSNDNGDSLAIVYRAPLRLALTDTAGGDVQPFLLQPGDQVFIRRLPGYAPLQTVDIVGQVTYPGTYTVQSKSERLSNLIQRAGGLTKEAYARGFRLYREGKPVAIDLPRALERPGSAADIIINPGDRLEVPDYDPLVLVTGKVAFDTQIRYERNLGVEDYLQRAGGVLEDGDEGRISVRYPNGELRTTQRKLGIRRYPRVEPGSTITVPERMSGPRTNWDQILSRSLTVLSTVATLLIAYSTVRN